MQTTRSRWRAVGVVAGMWLAAELIAGALSLQQAALGPRLVLAAIALVAFAAHPVAWRRPKGGPR